MKRLMAVATMVVLAMGSSGCISVHKETHEAKHNVSYVVADDSVAVPDRHDGGTLKDH